MLGGRVGRRREEENGQAEQRFKGQGGSTVTQQVGVKVRVASLMKIQRASSCNPVLVVEAGGSITKVS
ncbi:hypothetical protein Pmani_034433 [Petrolisthes manimaculis]|uniref:Uncharacterized protein n=1 Tax=Petrolisthes manimaculis TaxID=1843537 RepID=A0AAE1NMR3_9EUCA|nr:hypothetical protein Pmani_034433 [Petrolisthes manimaculis]